MYKEYRKGVSLRNLLGLLILFFLFFAAAACYSQNKVGTCECKSIKDKTGLTIKQELFNVIIKKHEEWKQKRSGGAEASLSGFSLHNCTFQNWNLSNINFSGTSLIEPRFENVNLSYANFNNVDLSRATFSKVTLIGTKINGVKFDNAIIDENHPLIFQPEIDNSSFTIADVISLANVQEGSLRALRFTGKDSLALEALLKKFDDYGFKKQAKEIIYALKESERKESASGKENWHGYISSGPKWFLFKATCQWGLYPINCIYLIFLTVLVFSFPYMIALGIFKSRTGDGDAQCVELDKGCKICFVKLLNFLKCSTLYIWRFVRKHLCKYFIILMILLICIYIFNCIYKIYQCQKGAINFLGILFIGVLCIFFLCGVLFLSRRYWREGYIEKSYPSDSKNKKDPEKIVISSPYDIIVMALYFSLISAFNIGWRELNIGDWITRIQPNDYSYKATGWVKVLAGIESLICTYLLALWVLTYFGSPFNW